MGYLGGRNIRQASISYDGRTAHDAQWVAALTENAPKGIASNIDTLKKTFMQIADSYNGVSGNTTLDAAGDTKYGHYDFWRVKEDAPPNSNSFHWEVAPSIP